ncbi:hypothetical protein X293_08060 [Oenococcus oeni IOEB_C52]|nr:hypothetical protein X293_08060 [Oenococcus oeni IOEB_C52]
MEGKRGSECLLKPVSNIDFNPYNSAEHPNTVRTKQISFTDKISTMKEFDLPAASINIFQFKLIK